MRWGWCAENPPTGCRDRAASSTWWPSRRGGAATTGASFSTTTCESPVGRKPWYERSSDNGTNPVSMDFGFDLISADEYERQLNLYGPLTDALRRLIDAGIRTAVDEDTVREAQAAIEAATAALEREQHVAAPTLRHEATGRPL